MSGAAVKAHLVRDYLPGRCADIKRVTFQRAPFASIHRASTPCLSRHLNNRYKQHSWTEASSKRVGTIRSGLNRRKLLICKGTERDETARVSDEDNFELSLEDIVKEVVASKFEESTDEKGEPYKSDLQTERQIEVAPTKFEESTQHKKELHKSDLQPGLQIDVAPKVLEALQGTGELQGKSLFELVEEKRKLKRAEKLKQEENTLNNRLKNALSRLKISRWFGDEKKAEKKADSKNGALWIDTVYVDDPPLHKTFSTIKEFLQSDQMVEYNGQAWALFQSESTEDAVDDYLDEAFVATYTIPWVQSSATGVHGQKVKSLPTPMAEQILDLVVVKGKRTLSGPDLEARGLASSRKLVEARQLQQEVFRSGPFYPTWITSWVRAGEKHSGGWVVTGSIEGEPAEARQRLQARLDQHFPEYNLVVLLLNTPQEVPWCLVLPADEPIQMDLLEGVPSVFASAALSALTMWYCKGMAIADPLLLKGEDAAIALAALPLGLLTILFSGSIARSAVASFYGVRDRFPLPFPVPGLGAIGMSAPLRGVLPNRAALIDIPLAGSLATAAASIAMMVSSHSWLARLFPQQGPLILVPPETLQHSYVLSWLVFQLEKASVVGPDDVIYAAIHPLAFAGLLGLNATALSLLPLGRMDGSRIVQGLLGREWHQTACYATFMLLLVGLVFGDTSLSFWLLAFNTDVARSEWYQKDEISEVGFFRTLVAFVTMAMGVIVLSPTFSWLPFHSLLKHVNSVQSLLPTWGNL